jgi:hypothetical protein
MKKTIIFIAVCEFARAALLVPSNTFFTLLMLAGFGLSALTLALWLHEERYP